MRYKERECDPQVVRRAAGDWHTSPARDQLFAAVASPDQRPGSITLTRGFAVANFVERLLFLSEQLLWTVWSAGYIHQSHTNKNLVTQLLAHKITDQFRISTLFFVGWLSDYTLHSWYFFYQ